MAKTILLTFIHGFKGNDNTFHTFPSHLRDLINESTAGDVKVETAVYPKYETRGDLPACVEAFREWLLHRVLTLEKQAENTSPRENPTVGVILVAHSMGGLVATDSLLSLLDSASEPDIRTKDTTPLFPQIQGILSFDTPYSGLSRSMFAYGAFAQYQNVTNAYGLVTALTGAALPLSAAGAASSAPAWRAYQAIAMRTGAAGAIAAAGAAAYMNREKIGQGMAYMNKDDISRGLSAVNVENLKQMMSGVSRENIEQGLAYISRENIGQGMAWLSGHLQFVSALMRGDELTTRLERLSAMQGIGFANLYTSLGPNDTWSGGYFVAERTFCAVPPEKAKASRFFIKEVNTKVKDEIEAHMSMFKQDKNSGYDEMAAHARGLVLSWAKNNSGVVLDPYKGRKVEEAPAPSPFTKYTFHPDTGLKETDTPKSGWSTPAFPDLAGYIPNMTTAGSKDTDSTGTPTKEGWHTPNLAAYIPTRESREGWATPDISAYIPSREGIAGLSNYIPSREGKEGWTPPTYAGLSSYMTNIPKNLRSRSASQERTRGEASAAAAAQYAAGLSKYLWSGKARSKGDEQAEASDRNDSSTTNATSDGISSQSSSGTEAGLPTDAATAAELENRHADERAAELVQFTGRFPGVTEDLTFEEEQTASETGENPRDVAGVTSSRSEINPSAVEVEVPSQEEQGADNTVVVGSQGSQDDSAATLTSTVTQGEHPSTRALRSDSS